MNGLYSSEMRKPDGKGEEFRKTKIVPKYLQDQSKQKSHQTTVNSKVRKLVNSISSEIIDQIR